MKILSSNFKVAFLVACYVVLVLIFAVDFIVSPQYKSKLDLLDDAITDIYENQHGVTGYGFKKSLDIYNQIRENSGYGKFYSRDNFDNFHGDIDRYLSTEATKLTSSDELILLFDYAFCYKKDESSYYTGQCQSALSYYDISKDDFHRIVENLENIVSIKNQTWEILTGVYLGNVSNQEKDYNKAIKLLHEVWLSGDDHAAFYLHEIYTRIGDVRNSYLWSLRNNDINKTNEKGLKLEEIKAINQQAKIRTTLSVLF